MRSFAERIFEADEFYRDVIPASLSEDGRHVMRQAFAGMLWSKAVFTIMTSPLGSRAIRSAGSAP